ncbi:MAG: HAD-IC family P-type ATPase, partial [Nitrososphaerota archaeon]|nr:HAD-IC family P-type ATPase [Nitrososphaerota archaeon]
MVKVQGKASPTKVSGVSTLKYSSPPLSEVFREFGTSDQGLSDDEAKRRLAIYGPNELPRERLSWFSILQNQFRNPMFLILLVVAFVSGFLGQPEQAAVILVIMGLSVILGFYNEFRAQRLVEELQKSVSIKVVVTRNGKRCEVDSTAVVPGDILDVYIGDIIAADTRIIDSKELEINEAVLTGESFPVEKNAKPLEVEPLSASQSSNLMFMGTIVTRGSANGIVLSTGKSTVFGSIAKTLAHVRPETEFQRGTKRYGTLLLYLTFFLAIGIFGFNALVGHPLLNSLLFALVVAIGIVPELMPGIVTIALSRGAHKMAKEQVIVKRLASMENLGNIEVLCTDKTGTLTEGKIILSQILSPDLKPGVKTLPLALVCNTAIVGRIVAGNPMDAAIWEYAIQHNLEDSASRYKKVDEIPFDYDRRIMSVIARSGNELFLITKGAPESVFHRCTNVEWENEIKPLDSELANRIESEVANFSREGFRVLAASYRSVEAKSMYDLNDEYNLTLAGFLVFTDPPKQGAGEAIAKLGALGVDTKIVTG